jgi:hypothetical protein
LLLLREAVASDSLYRKKKAHRPPSEQLLLLCAVTLVLFHWYACINIVVDLSSPDSSWLLELYGPTLDDLHGRALWRIYVTTFRRGLLIISGEGTPTNTEEDALLAVLGQCGGLLWIAYLTGEIVRLISRREFGQDAPITARARAMLLAPQFASQLKRARS